MGGSGASLGTSAGRTAGRVFKDDYTEDDYLTPKNKQDLAELQNKFGFFSDIYTKRSEQIHKNAEKTYLQKATVEQLREMLAGANRTINLQAMDKEKLISTIISMEY